MSIRASSRRISGIPGRSKSLIPNNNNSSTAGLGQVQVANRVVMNVGGVRFETYRSTLKSIPDTRLAWLTDTSSSSQAGGAGYDPDKGEFFFDRHPGVFTMILNYYRTGKLHAPIDVCGPLFEEELAFWGIDETQIEPCCWPSYRTFRDAQDTLKELEGDSSDGEDDDEDNNVAGIFGLEEERKTGPPCCERWKNKVWTLLDQPNSSRGAKVIAVISLLFVLVSILCFCLETHVMFRVPRNASEPIQFNWTSSEKNTKSKPTQTLEILDYVCIAYFTIEFILRLIYCPNKKLFFQGILNWVDVCSIIPFFVEKTIIGIDYHLEYTVLIQVLKTIRLVRIFRIFKLTRHFSGLKILAHSIKASGKELLLLIIFLIISVLIFACLIYYAESVEQHPNNDFNNIPIGFWWAVVTMTTLGYGDMYPRTGLGYLVGALCAVSGVLVLALPVPVIVNNFALYYSHAQAKLKLPKKKKRVLIGAHDDLKTSLGDTDSSEYARTEVGSAHQGDDGMKTRQSHDNGPIERKVSYRRRPSPSHSVQSSSGDRKDSDDSALGSLDANAGNPEGFRQTGISVVYMDETSEYSSPGKQASTCTALGKNKVHPAPEPHINKSDVVQHPNLDKMNTTTIESIESISNPLLTKWPFERRASIKVIYTDEEEHPVELLDTQNKDSTRDVFLKEKVTTSDHHPLLERSDLRSSCLVQRQESPDHKSRPHGDLSNLADDKAHHHCNRADVNVHRHGDQQHGAVNSDLYHGDLQEAADDKDRHHGGLQDIADQTVDSHESWQQRAGYSSECVPVNHRPAGGAVVPLNVLNPVEDEEQAAQGDTLDLDSVEMNG